jgi:trehalose-6-phosphatase
MALSSAQATPRSIPPPPLLGARVALFLDFDGTLAPLANPSGPVQVHAALPALLAAAGRRLGGALAIRSARRLEDVDRRLAPFACGGAPVRALLRRAPFAGRRPVFVGDAVTDEEGFAAASEFGGYGIKVGGGPTRAAYRLDRPEDICGWLQASLEAGSTGT